MDKVKVGVVGCGAFARSQHFPNCIKNPRIELKTVCSRTEKTRLKAMEDYDAQVAVAEAAEVFSDPELDIVILSVPHETHFEMVMGALEAGKNVLCEKPMAMTVGESYDIVRAVRKAGTKLCVDYNRRFSPSMQYMKQRYMAHRANPVTSAGQYVEAAGRPTLPEEEASMLMIRINDESSTYRPVHLDWKTGGGQIIGESCHWLDLACWLLEDTPVRVYASGSTRLSHIITLDFAQGHRACIFFSPTGTFEYPKELFELTDHATLYRNLCFVETEVYGAAGEDRQLFPLQADEVPQAGTQGGLSGYVDKLRERAKIHAESNKAQWPDLFPDKGHYQLLDAFVDAVLNDTPSPIDEVAGAKATYLCRRAIDSIREGQPLPVNMEDYEFFVDA